MNLEAKFDLINHELFTVHGTMDYQQITAEIIELCELIKMTETDESTWSIGEFGECDLGSFIVGAYWHYTEWHGGQSSMSYAALCALGSIFSPGMSSEPEPDSSEFAAYERLGEIASKYFESVKG